MGGDVHARGAMTPRESEARHVLQRDIVDQTTHRSSAVDHTEANAIVFRGHTLHVP
jgi:hypothetical protein